MNYNSFLNSKYEDLKKQNCMNMYFMKWSNTDVTADLPCRAIFWEGFDYPMTSCIVSIVTVIQI